MDRISFVNFLSVQSNKPTKKLSFDKQHNYDSTEQNLAKLSPDNYKAYFMNKVSFGKKIDNPCNGFQTLMTDGAGSFFMLPVGIANFSKYGGFSTAYSDCIPAGNDLIMPFIEETVAVGNKDLISLSEIIHKKENYEENLAILRKQSPIIKSVDVYPVPTWEYDFGEGAKLKKEIAMPRTYNKEQECQYPAQTGSKLVIGYTNTGDKPIFIQLNPYLNYRNYHYNNSPNEWKMYDFDGKAYFKAIWEDNSSRQIMMTSNQTKNSDKKPFFGYMPGETLLEGYEDKGPEQDIYYINDQVRGFNDHTIKAFKNGYFFASLQPGESFSLTVTPGDDKGALKSGYDIKHEVEVEKQRLEDLFKQSQLPDTDNARTLLRASDQFVVHRVLRHGSNNTEGHTSIIAGYPWFKDWSRDSMISLPGLLLATKRYDDAKSVLTMWAKYMKDGQLPNTFDFSQNNEPQFGGMDGTFYWFSALDEFVQAVKKDGKSEEYKDFIKDQYYILKDVVERNIYGRHSFESLVEKGHYDNTYKDGVFEEHGVEYNPDLAEKLIDIIGCDKDKSRKHVGPNWLQQQVGMDSDGLIACDQPHLTWMDAQSQNIVHVPRAGKPVEINALWYNGLSMMKELAERFGEKNDAERYGKLAKLVGESMQKFIRPDGKGLYDLIDVIKPYEDSNDPISIKRAAKVVDDSVRPNQIIAVSLRNSPFDSDTTKDILKVAEEELLTPMGLRTLSPCDTKYQSHYADFNYNERESQYHKGTVWPWLIGPFCNAYLNAYGKTQETREEAEKKVYGFIKPLLDHMNGEADMKYQAEGGSVLGGIAEIADGGTQKETPEKDRKDYSDHMAKGCFSQAWSVASVLDIYNKVQDVAKAKEGKSQFSA